jgi:hypothetical protein
MRVWSAQKVGETMKVQFKSGSHQIEAALDQSATASGVIVTHPHPLYGGTMSNPVVETIAAAYRQKGHTTLRFNFRGVGQSQGSYGDGIGEQQDVRSALSYLRSLGIENIGLAGYSFGAWVNALVSCEDRRVADMIMVSPPVAFLDFGQVHSLPCLKLVISGSEDDIAPSGLIRNLVPNWNPQARFEVIPGCDHFFGGHLTKLEELLAGYLPHVKSE